MTGSWLLWGSFSLIAAAVVIDVIVVARYCKRMDRLESAQEEAGRQHGLLSGRLNQLANVVVDTTSTGPIPLLDRPSPAQIAAPTRPDLEAQHSAVPAAESYGRHAHRSAA